MSATNGVLLRLLSDLRTLIKRIGTQQSLSLKQYKQDWKTQYVMERLIQNSVQLIHEADKIFADKKVDFVLLNNADPVFCHEIYACRNILFERNARQRVEAEARKEDAYFDFLPCQQYFNQQILRIRQVSS